MDHDLLTQLYIDMDALCWKCHHAEDWSEFDNLLDSIDVQNTDLDLLLCYLITSSWAKKHLTRRDALYQNVHKLLEHDPERDRILVNLK